MTYKITITIIGLILVIIWLPSDIDKLIEILAYIIRIVELAKEIAEVLKEIIKLLSSGC